MTVKKENIIKEAKERGFESSFLCNKPYKYSSHEDLRWFLWLTELQKWLRETHNFHVTVDESWELEKVNDDIENIKRTGKIEEYTCCLFSKEYDQLVDGFQSYEAALTYGVYEALIKEFPKLKQ